MKTAIALVALFVVIFCGVGLGMGYFGIAELIQGEASQGLLLLVGGLAFGGSGAGILALTIVGARRKAQEDALQLAQPNEPWLWREDWAEGQVRSSTKSEAWFLWGFAFLWNIICIPLAMFLPEESTGQAQLCRAPRAALPVGGHRTPCRRCPDEHPATQVRQLPLSHGSRPRGPGRRGVRRGPGSRRDRGPTRGATIRLSCINQVRSGSGRNSSTTEHILWQEEQSGILPSSDPRGRGALLPVRFRIPCDARPTDSTDPDNAILWRLVAQAAVSGVDFTTDFEIPVFLTPASSRAATEEQLRSEALATVAERLVPTPESGITVLPSRGGGIEFRLSRGRQSAGTFPLAAFTVLWTGVVALLLFAGAPFIFPAVFGGLDVLLFLILLFLWFGGCRVVVESGDLSVQTVLFGLESGKRIPCSTIAKISVGDAYSVDITQKEGEQLHVWWMFRRKHAADWLADEIRKAVAPWRNPESPVPGQGGRP